MITLKTNRNANLFKYASAYLFLEQACSFYSEINDITINLELEIMKQITLRPTHIHRGKYWKYTIKNI